MKSLKMHISVGALIILAYCLIGFAQGKETKPPSVKTITTSNKKISWDISSTGNSYIITSPKISVTINYKNVANPTELFLTDVIAQKAGLVNSILNWLTPQYTLETKSGIQIPLILTPLNYASLKTNNDLITSTQSFGLFTTYSDNSIWKSCSVLFLLTRQIYPNEGKIVTQLEFNNQSKEPLLIRSDILMPVSIPRKYDNVDIVYPSGLVRTLSLGTQPEQYRAFFEDPLAIKFWDSKTNFGVMLYTTDNANHRLNLNIRPRDYICDVETDLVNQVLSPNDLPRKNNTILPYLLPGQKYNLGYVLQTRDNKVDLSHGIGYLSWYPKGYDTAFCLQADEIKPDKITPETAQNRYNAVENVMLGKAHKQFPEMKMQVIAVVDDINPNDTPQEEPRSDDSTAPYLFSINDLYKHPKDVALYKNWLNQDSAFFKIQSHAIHHSTSSVKFGDFAKWEFNPNTLNGSGKSANDYPWITAMIKRLKTELEELGLGKQRYFKAPGYSRSYLLPQVLAEEGYWVWDFNPTTGNPDSEPFHVRFRYVAPGGQVLWIMGSGPELEGYRSGQEEKYWSDINRQLSRGYPFVTSGHLELLNDTTVYNLLAGGWKRMYENYHVWNAFPDEMADYWESRYHLKLTQSSTPKRIQLTLTNNGDKTVKDASVCYLFPSPPPSSFKILLDNKSLKTYRLKKNLLYLWSDISPHTTKSFYIQW